MNWFTAIRQGEVGTELIKGICHQSGPLPSQTQLLNPAQHNWGKDDFNSADLNKGQKATEKVGLYWKEWSLSFSICGRCMEEKNEMKLLRCPEGKSLIHLLKRKAERAAFFCRQRQRTGQTASETWRATIKHQLTWDSQISGVCGLRGRLGKWSLGQETRGWWNGQRKGGGTRQSKSNQISLTGGHQPIRQVWVDFGSEGAEKLNKVLRGSRGKLGESSPFSGSAASRHRRPDV